MFFFKRKKNITQNLDWLVVGLGNPEKKYLANRHNIGWTVASELNQKYKGNFSKESKNYFSSFIQIESKSLLLALPRTYMNNSGIAVLEIINKYKIPFEKIIVIVDEYNFPLGKIQLKSGGGDGGHNGIASIIDHINSNNFFRLRCGIGKNFSSGEMANYVLSDFNKDEINVRNDMIKKAVDSIETLIRLDPPRAMSLINSGNLWINSENLNEKSN